MKKETVSFANAVVKSSALTWLLKLMFFLNLSWISNYQVLQYSMILLWIGEKICCCRLVFSKKKSSTLASASSIQYVLLFLPEKLWNATTNLLKSLTKFEENPIWPKLEATPLVSFKINFRVSVFFQSWLEEIQYKYSVVGLDLWDF